MGGAGEDTVPFAPIPEILDEVRAGRTVILVDDENRENEGDLLIAAEKVTPEAVNFMIKHGRGLVCLAITPERAEALGLRPQTSDNTTRFGTAFLEQVDARLGTTTGISPAERAHTIQTAIRGASGPSDLVKPGHVMTLRARSGGVLVRAGQTEGAVDLARMAGLLPAGVICEVIRDDGKMARLPDLEEFAAEHDVRIASVADIIEYRRRTERLVECTTTVKLPTRRGDFDLHLYECTVTGQAHLALTVGALGPGHEPREEATLVRVHSQCLTGDVFGSRRCDCGDQLEAAMSRVHESGCGALLYLRQEGRGIGLENKIRAYALQEKGRDTVDANIELGFAPDLRDYGIGAQILCDLGVRKMRLLTNNPRKIVGLTGYGLEVVERVPLEVAPGEHNREYLAAKRTKLGHMLGTD
jgi:3,4-dihydroxy 2-butanone 4-phosphate synthase/GTP cyclohydrolase II